MAFYFKKSLVYFQSAGFTDLKQKPTKQVLNGKATIHHAEMCRLFFIQSYFEVKKSLA